MTNTTPFLRLFTVAALLTGTMLVAGCSSPDKVTRTTTSEQSTSTTPAPMPPPVVSSTTTTTTHESRP